MGSLTDGQHVFIFRVCDALLPTWQPMRNDMRDTYLPVYTTGYLPISERALPDGRFPGFARLSFSYEQV